jgi:hypothetical protein
MSKTKGKSVQPTPHSQWIERLRGITGALTYLVDILPKDEFLAMFRKLHDENNTKLAEDLRKK